MAIVLFGRGGRRERQPNDEMAGLDRQTGTLGEGERETAMVPDGGGKTQPNARWEEPTRFLTIVHTYNKAEKGDKTCCYYQ